MSARGPATSDGPAPLVLLEVMEVLDMVPVDARPGLGCHTAMLGPQAGVERAWTSGREDRGSSPPLPRCPKPVPQRGVGYVWSPCDLVPHLWNEHHLHPETRHACVGVVLSWVLRCVGEPENLLECAVPVLGGPLSGAPPGKHI